MPMYNYAVNFGNTSIAQHLNAIRDPYNASKNVIFAGAPFANVAYPGSPGWRAVGGTFGLQSITDGTSNTVVIAEVLQGEMYDVRGLLWSSIPGGGSFFSRLPPNNPTDYYQTGLYGDQLNQPIFCINEPGMGLPCQGNAGDQRAYAGARSRHPDRRRPVALARGRA